MKKVNVCSALLGKCWLLLLAVAVLFAGCGSSGETADTQSTVQAEPETAEVTEAVITEEAFVAVLKDALAGAVGEGESIADVVLSNGDLRVVVDMSNADPAPLTLADLAWSRAGSITDAILEFEEYDVLWETVTLDFGEAGKVTCSISDVASNEYGRYFPAELFNSLIGLD